MTEDPAALLVAAAGVLVAAAALVVAIIARRDAKNSADAARESAAAARRSAKAAEELTEIEKQKLHKDLTPHLSVEAVCQGPERLRLQIKLDGPDGLDRLDRLGASVRDDKVRHPVTAGTTQSELDATVWGPYRFVPKVDDADVLGRVVPSLPLARGESRTLVMEPSPVPTEAGTTEQWRQLFADHPIRLEMTCQRAGEPSWRLPIDVDPPRPNLIVDAAYRDENTIRVTVRNEGTAPASQVRFGAPGHDPQLPISAPEVPVLDVGRCATADVHVLAEAAVSQVDLSWVDYLGVHQQKVIDLASL